LEHFEILRILAAILKMAAKMTAILKSHWSRSGGHCSHYGGHFGSYFQYGRQNTKNFEVLQCSNYKEN
jgi:hypothetical protein